jgi:hypothetical protein
MAILNRTGVVVESGAASRFAHPRHRWRVVAALAAPD